MCAGSIIVFDEFHHCRVQMLFVQDDNVIEAFGAGVCLTMKRRNGMKVFGVRFWIFIAGLSV